MNKSKILSMFALACLLLSSCGRSATPPPVTNTPEIKLETVSTEPIPTSVATETLPPASPTPSDTGWQGEYFNNDQFQGPATLTRPDEALSFDWADGSPDPGIPADYFSVRWTRCLELEERSYKFTATADDFVRVLVDDLPVLETSFPAEREVPVTAGRHCIKVEYREVNGRATMNFSFEPGPS